MLPMAVATTAAEAARKLRSNFINYLFFWKSGACATDHYTQVC